MTTSLMTISILAGQMPSILEAASRKVVDDGHPVALRQQILAQVRTDDASSPGDEIVARLLC